MSVRNGYPMRREMVMLGGADNPEMEIVDQPAEDPARLDEANLSTLPPTAGRESNRRRRQKRMSQGAAPRWRRRRGQTPERAGVGQAAQVQSQWDRQHLPQTGIAVHSQTKNRQPQVVVASHVGRH